MRHTHTQPAAGRWPLLLGVAISLFAHLAAAGVLAVGGERLPVVGIPPTPPPEEERLRLGIERSEASTITWLGFEDPTPHEAPQADLEQAEFSIAAAQRLAEQVQQAASRAPQAIAALAEAVASEQTPAPPATPAGVEIPDVLARPAEIVAASPDASPASPLQPKPTTGESNPSPAGAPAQGAAGEATDSEGKSAENAAPRINPEKDGDADRDSPARSIRVPNKFTPGKPWATEGLEIRTVRAQWTHTTRLTTRPKDPVIRVYFNKQGVVARTAFERSSGSKFVDEPLLNAVYQWTAQGKALEGLTPEGPGSTIEVVFEIGLQ